MSGEAQVVGGDTDAFAWDADRNPLPRAADVAIIGGGIVGCAAAYYLARDGVSVALFEKGRIAGEQSGRNWGWVRQQGRSPIELPLMMQSLRLWQALASELGEDIGFHQGGTLYLAEDAAQLETLSEWLGTAREHGLDTRLLTGARNSTTCWPRTAGGPARSSPQAMRARNRDARRPRSRAEPCAPARAS